MSSRPKVKRDDLDLYIGWCLKNYASSAPFPKDGKQRLLRAAAASSSATVERVITPLSVLRAFGRALMTLLIFVERIIVSGPLPSDEELALLYTNSHREPFGNKVTLESISHLCPAAIGYFC
jgi:hypothetical protein